MHVKAISNFTYNRNNPSFDRRLKPSEEKDYHQTLENSYGVIGSDKRVVITHGSVYPAIGRNTHIGSPFGKAAQVVNSFYYLHGFNGVQLGPIGELESNKTSPYNASAFAKNKLFIDLEELTTNKYGKILTKDTYLTVTEPVKGTNKNYTRTNFSKAISTYETALSEAYQTFKTKTANNDPKINELNKEYQAFIDKHDERLTDEGVFVVLAKANAIEGIPNDNYNKWKSSLDSNLIVEMKNGNSHALNRYNEILDDNEDTINQHKFEQFIVSKQIKENQKWRQKLDFEYINDLLVGCSRMDAWRYKDVFMQDWEMGAREPDGKPPQRWGIPVIDPKKIFLNDQHELNRGGEFLKEKIDFALENCENIRVDHVMGLVEPFLIHKDTGEAKYISELRDPKRPDKEYDEFWDYPALLKHLVIPTFKEHGLEKETPVWEDICSQPDRFKNVFYNENGLPQITNADWSRVEDAMNAGKKNDWFILGSHDNMPVMNYFQREGGLKDGSTGEYTRQHNAWNSEYLAGYLNMDESREGIKEIRKDLAAKFENDDSARVFAKFAELMTTPKFQISFDDLFGITEEGVIYNVPGTKNKENWTERLTPDFIDKYYENLSSKNPTAINVPETLRNALQAKIDMEVKNHGYNDEFKQNIYTKCQPLLDKLDHYAEILKEPETKSEKH